MVAVMQTTQAGFDSRFGYRQVVRTAGAVDLFEGICRHRNG
jgi:hypothetical protein